MQSAGDSKRGFVKKSFLAMAFIACFSCLARADYNLALYAFAYILWDMEIPVNFFLNNLLKFNYIKNNSHKK